ncbi:spore germination protein [Cohnella sp. AR92]|uniref:spore germination protein n=1 Tax=Cohnella sp. AR92 TaxID=648716 RepID=UPI000F8C54D2|nr:spore germination protein [Cohnella sp. AR92]RUS46767.1 spore germination protein [Cohnella sp. AR92]
MRWFGQLLPFFRSSGRSQQGRRKAQHSSSGAGQGPARSADLNAALSRSLKKNLADVRRLLGDSADLTVREIGGSEGDSVAAVLYLESIVDSELVNRYVMTPLMEWTVGKLTGDRIAHVRENLPVGRLQELNKMGDLVTYLLNGYSIILTDGVAATFAAATTGGERRSVEEPSSQTVTRGPKESFTESILTNMTLLRRRIKSPDLRVESFTIGRKTGTFVNLLYLEGITLPAAVKEIRDRLAKIDVDSILDSGYIEEFIQEETWTLFPTIQNTERPDAVAAGLLEGQAAIIVDGSPFALLAPSSFVKFFQSSEDYYSRYDIASFLRIIRYISFLVSILLPSLYIAITTFHQEMLPTPLLISLASQREGVPFPALVEALLMELTFEVLREAGVRMPRVVGPAISIVGALVLGQAAVQAGLVSAAMIIVVSFTAIANFVIPTTNMSAAARLIRFFMMILGGTLGLFGIMSGLMVLLIHLVSLKSFGIPYMTPLAPFIWNNMKDVLVRVPWPIMKKRPMVSGQHNATRQADSMRVPSGSDRKREGGDR